MSGVRSPSDFALGSAPWARSNSINFALPVRHAARSGVCLKPGGGCAGASGGGGGGGSKVRDLGAGCGPGCGSSPASGGGGGFIGETVTINGKNKDVPFIEYFLEDENL